MKIYTGVGARKTPPAMQRTMTNLAYKLDKLGWKLRTGNAYGADSAFARGSTNKDVYSPKSLDSVSQDVFDKCYEDFMELHPAPHRCSAYARLLLMRDGLEIMGDNYDEPSRFVICWTPDGKEIGGTAQAIRLARKYGIEVFNLAKPEDFERLNNFIK